MKIKTTVQFYRKHIFNYGIYTILLVLKDLEQLEYYEECNKIIQAIKELELIIQEPLFQQLNENNINLIIEEYKKLNLNIKDMLENSIHYCNLIINQII